MVNGSAVEAYTSATTKRLLRKKSVCSQKPQKFVRVHKHEENRHYDIIDVDKQSAHEHDIDELAAKEAVARKDIGSGQCDHQQDKERQTCHKNGVEEIFSHFGLLKGIYEILEIYALWQCPRVSIKFGIFFDGRQKDPAYRYDNTDGKRQERYIDKIFTTLSFKLILNSFLIPP